MTINTVNITNEAINSMTSEMEAFGNYAISQVIKTTDPAWAQKVSVRTGKFYYEFLFGNNEVQAASWKDDVLAIIRQGQQMLLQAGEEGRLALTTQALSSALEDDEECAMYSTLLFTLGVITPEGDFVPAGDALERDIGPIEGIYIRDVSDEEVIKAFIIAASWIF